MSTFERLGLFPYIAGRVRGGSTYGAIVRDLRVALPGVRGISVRSLKRFCAARQLHATSRCSDHVLDILVAYGAGIVSWDKLHCLDPASMHRR